MLPAAAITLLSSEAREFRVSEGVERHPIAVAIIIASVARGGQALPTIAQRSRIHRNPNPVKTPIVDHR
jgi:hypothetical protein